MLTSVSETSLFSYRAIKRDGTLSRQQARIMDAIEPGKDYSLQEIVKLTGLAVNAVSGRVNELRKLDRLELSNKRPCWITGKTIAPVRRPMVAQRVLF